MRQSQRDHAIALFESVAEGRSRDKSTLRFLHWTKLLGAAQTTGISYMRPVCARGSLNGFPPPVNTYFEPQNNDLTTPSSSAHLVFRYNLLATMTVR